MHPICVSDVLYYTGEGEFTKHDESVRAIADRITSNDLLVNINRYVASLPYKKNAELWRSRTAGQIIEDQFSTGCTDNALVFAALARAKGFPVIYIETVEAGYLRGPMPDPFEGHIFLEVYESYRWTPYNPGYGQTKKEGKEYLLYPDDPDRIYVPFAWGRDFSELFANGFTKPIKLGTTKQIRSLIEELGLRE